MKSAPARLSEVMISSTAARSSIRPFSLFRTFKLTERFNLQFRADAANFFNSPHFAKPHAGCKVTVSATDLTCTNGGDFLSITSAKNDERQFRFGLRLAF